MNLMNMYRDLLYLVNSILHYCSKKYIQSTSLILIFICIGNNLHAQQKEVDKNDSTKLYKDIEKYSKKRGFTGFLYGIFFKPIESPTSKRSINKKKKLQKPFSAYEGKIIRNIEISTLDPFGNSVADTKVIEQKGVLNTANKIHIKTQALAIRNLLLIKRNEPFDSLNVNESERLIRSQKYVREVAFNVVPTSKNSDSVDIYIRVLDLWSLIPAVSITPSRGTIGLNDRNFLGLGHNFDNQFVWNHSNGTNAFNSIYFIPNIHNTYINAILNYGFDEEKNYIKSLNIERPYYSPYAKWAGGIYLDNRIQKGELLPKDSFLTLPDTKFSTQDFWGSASSQLFKGNSEDERSTNLITGLRFLRIRYDEMPAGIIDSLQLYSGEDFYLAGIGISTRKFIKDKYIFNYGLIEDVPVGKVYGITAGYQVKGNKNRYYLGLRFSYGDYFKWGFVSSNIEYGSFIKGLNFQQSVLVAGLNYFTDLFEIGNWKFRQFVNPKIIFGFNRIYTDNLTINNENGLPGFDSEILSGSKKIVLRMQTQSYAPWTLLGFRFGPYAIYSVGMLGDYENGFQRSRIYSQFGVGFLIKNEFLVYNILQISFSFYPLIPGIGDNIFRVNSVRTTDFGFQTYDFGKPTPVLYQ